MSKIGRKPIELPNGVQLTVDKGLVKVKGSKGEMTQNLTGDIQIEVKEGKVFVSRGNDTNQTKALHGLYRSLIQNMVSGVSKGFSRVLELSGTGYRAAVQGKTLNLSLGFSHPVNVVIPKDVDCKVDNQTKVILSGIDKQVIGQIAANIKKIRPAEPYQGKGIKYEGERVRRKAGKTGKK